MSLSCSCDYEPEPGDQGWGTAYEFSRMPLLPRRERCCSCSEFIESDSEVVQIERRKVPETDIEIKTYGKDGAIPLPPWYLCEKCGGIYLTLVELGYDCIDPRETLLAQKEYWAKTGFDPDKYKARA